MPWIVNGGYDSVQCASVRCARILLLNRCHGDNNKSEKATRAAAAAAVQNETNEQRQRHSHHKAQTQSRKANRNRIICFGQNFYGFSFWIEWTIEWQRLAASASHRRFQTNAISSMQRSVNGKHFYLKQVTLAEHSHHIFTADMMRSTRFGKFCVCGPASVFRLLYGQIEKSFYIFAYSRTAQAIPLHLFIRAAIHMAMFCWHNPVCHTRICAPSRNWPTKQANKQTTNKTKKKKKLITKSTKRTFKMCLISRRANPLLPMESSIELNTMCKFEIFHAIMHSWTEQCCFRIQNVTTKKKKRKQRNSPETRDL